METATVGKVIVGAKIENVFDLYEVSRDNSRLNRSAALKSPTPRWTPVRRFWPCQGD